MAMTVTLRVAEEEALSSVTTCSGVEWRSQGWGGSYRGGGHWGRVEATGWGVTGVGWRPQGWGGDHRVEATAAALFGCRSCTGFRTTEDEKPCQTLVSDVGICVALGGSESWLLQLRKLSTLLLPLFSNSL